MSLAHEIEKERCRRDPHYFIFEKLVTKDEHAASQGRQALEKFPDEECLRATIDDYLVSAKLLRPAEAIHSLNAGTPLEQLEHWYSTGIYFTEKSRHVMATWTTCAYLLWRARSFPHQLIIVQSKREEDAAALVYDKEPDQGKISFLEWSLPEHLRMAKLPAGGKYCHLYFPNGSHIWGIPEGGHIIRSHNPSVVFSDEAAFQPEFGNAYTAALPAITHGGQLICVSSAQVGEFMTLCETEAPQ
jgi:hypothetical protein